MPRPRKIHNDEILAHVHKILEDGGEFSSQELGNLVGLSRPTINRRLREMNEQNLLRVKPYRDENGHRRYTVKVLAKGRKRVERMAAA